MCNLQSLSKLEKDKETWNALKNLASPRLADNETGDNDKEEVKRQAFHRADTTTIFASDLTGVSIAEFMPEFYPRITFPNATDFEIQLKTGNTEFFGFVEAGGDFDKDQIIYNFQIRCTFREYYELDSFPFDCQDLPIIMKLGGDANSKDYRFLPDKTRKVFAKIDLSTCVSTEWNFHPTMYEFGFTDASLSKRGITYPLYINRIKIERKYQFYFQRIALILMLLSIAALSSFSIDVDNKEDRLSIDFTLLLTVVAFQVVINDSLPVLPFFTVIDVYVLMVLLFIIIIIIEHSLIGDSQDDLDQIFTYVFMAIWLVFHIGFGIYCPIISRKEKQKLTMNSSELEKYIKDDQNEGVVAHKMKFNADDIKQIESGKWASGVGQTVTHQKKNN